MPVATAFTALRYLRCTLQFAVNVRQTATPVPFWIAYTDPANDTDLSRHLHNEALAEGGITALA